MDEPDDSEQLEAMKRTAFQRQRIQWVWIGLLPGILWPLALIVWFRGFPPVAWAFIGLVWSTFCATKLAGFRQKMAGTDQTHYGCAAAFLLLVGNSVIAMAIFYGACAIMASQW